MFDFKGDLYGTVLDVAFIGFIREELKFDSVDALVVQMNDDSARSRASWPRHRWPSRSSGSSVSRLPKAVRPSRQGFAISAAGCYGKAHVCAAHHRISGPASA